jgi:all-trans-retinol 13,14-reductase
MIQSYKKPHQLEKQYDAVIIGTGMGSLTSAAFLAKEGKKVLLLERHYTAGGFTHVFKRKGYEWDVGIHYIGEVQKENSALRKMFDYISNGKLLWADMGEVYDQIIIGDKKFNFVKGVDAFKDQLTQYFPREKKAIEDYINLVFKANKAMGKFYINKALPKFIGNIVGGMLKKPYQEFSNRTTYEVLRSLTENEELIKVLCGQYGDYGLPPKQSSFAMHASVVKHYFGGGSFPVGGSSQIVKTIAPVIESAKGTILINAEVKEIITKKERAIGVKMSDDKCFYAPIIISGVGVINTFKKLISKENKFSKILSEQLTKVKPSVAHGCLYIGLNGTPEELKLPKKNLWIYPDDLDHDDCVSRFLKDHNEPFPVVYISFPSSKDPSWSERYPNKSTIDIITLLPFKSFHQWEGSKWMKRGESYEAFKEKFAQRLLEYLFELFPHLRNQIDCYELSTPLTTKHFVNYEKGELYGLDHSPERYQQSFLSPRTPIKGLYLTGQDIVTAGIGGALFSGFITATTIEKKNFWKKIYA